METANFKTILDQMQKALECSICLDLLSNPVSTKCDHQFCRFCITKFLQNNRSVACPLCKKPVTKRALQERSELSLVIDNVKKLIAAYELDTGNKYSPSRVNQGIFSTTPEVNCCNTKARSKQKADGALMKSSTRAESIKKNLIYGDLSKITSPLTASDGELHRPPEDGILLIPRTRTRLKAERSVLVTPPDPVEELPIRRQSITPDLTENEHKFRLGKQENAGSSVSLEQTEGPHENIVQHNGHISMQHDNEHKDQMSKDLLHYLEEGSCGAAFDENMDLSGGKVKNNVNEKQREFNQECNSAVKTPHRAKKRASYGKTDNSEAMEYNNKKLFLRSSKSKLPLSPSKLNAAMPSSDIQFKSLSVILPNQKGHQHTEAKENVALKNSEFIQLPPLDIVNTSRDVCSEVTSPVSHASSISSTQQLMKPKPVTARTYSRDMRKTFPASFVRHWADTLPKKMEGGSNQLNQRRGLTTKEKINAKKPQRQSGQPPSECAYNATYSDPAGTCLNNVDACSSSGDISKPNEKSHFPFELPLTPVTRRKSIFKSRVQITDKRKDEPVGEILPTVLINEEDPYEFRVGQTPVKSKGKIAVQKDRLQTRKSKGVKADSKMQQKHEKIKSRKCEVVTVQNMSLDVMLCSDQLPMLDCTKQCVPSVEPVSKNNISDNYIDVPKTSDNQEPSCSSFQIKNVQKSCTQKMVCFSHDLVDINKSLNKEDINADGTSTAETNHLSLKADSGDKVIKQNNCELLQGGTVQTAQTASVLNLVPESVSETMSSEAPGAESSLELSKYTSKNDKVQVSGNTGSVQMSAFGTYLDQSSVGINQPKNEIQQHQSRKAVQKRKLARKRKNRCSDEETFSQKCGKELVTLIHNISQAEDHELLFSTQEAQQKLQKELQHKEAFGFDILESDVCNVSYTQDMEHETVNATKEVENDQSQLLKTSKSLLADDEMVVHKDIKIPDVKEKTNVSVMLQKASGSVNSDQVKIPDHVKDASVSGGSNISKVKSVDVAAEENHIIDDEEENMIICNVTEAEEKGTTQFNLQPRQMKNVVEPKPNNLLVNYKPWPASVAKRKAQNFSRPNFSEMVMVSPGTNDMLTHSNLLTSRNVCDSVSGLSDKVSSSVRKLYVGTHSGQPGDDSERHINSDVQVPLTSDKVLGDDISRKHTYTSSLNVTCKQDVHTHPHNMGPIDETMNPLCCNPIISSASMKTTLNDETTDKQENTRKASHTAQLSLESDVSKSSAAILDKINNDLAADKISTDLAADRISTDLAADKIGINLATDKISTDLATDKISTDLATDKISTDLATDKISTDLATYKISTDLATDKISTDLATYKISTDLAADRISTDLAADKINTDLAADKINTDLAADKISTDLAVDKISTDIGADNVITDFADVALDHDIILAVDTCMDNYNCESVSESSKNCMEKAVDPVVLETLDFNFDHDFSNNENADYISSPNNMGIGELEQNETSLDATTASKSNAETIAETQCWSTQSTEDSTTAPPKSQFVSQQSISPHSYSLGVSCKRTDVTCADTAVLANSLAVAETSQKINLEQSLVVAETSQETVSGQHSVLSQSILMPADLKRPVPEVHKENLLHPVSSFSKYPEQSPYESQLSNDNNTKLSNLTVNRTPHAHLCPKNQVSSVPSRSNFSGSEDEDHVLIVRRAKRKCFSLSGSPLKPVVFANEQQSMEGKKFVISCDNQDKQPVLYASDQHCMEETELSVINGNEHCADLIGETEAMKMIDTWTEQEMEDDILSEEPHRQEQNTITETKEVEMHTNDTEQVCPSSSCIISVSHNSLQPLVEVTPIGKLRYIDSSGKFVIYVDDGTPDGSSKRKSRKRLFSATPESYLTRGSTKGKLESGSGSQNKEISSIGLDDVQSEDSNKNNIHNYEPSVPESNISSQSIHDQVMDKSSINSMVDNCLDGSEIKSRKVVEKSTSVSRKSYAIYDLKKLKHTKRGLAKKGSLKLGHLSKHPRGILSPASKASIRSGIEKAILTSTDADQTTTTENSTDIIDIDDEVEVCDGNINHNKLTCGKSHVDAAVCVDSVKDGDLSHCSQRCESDLALVKTQNVFKKHKKPKKMISKKKIKEARRDENDEKERLERELFGLEHAEVQFNNNERIYEKQEAPSKNIQSILNKNLKEVAHSSDIHHPIEDDDDSDLVFDLGDSTDEEIACENGVTVNVKTRLDKSKRNFCKNAEQPDKSIQSSGSLPLTSSPVEMECSIGHDNIDEPKAKDVSTALKHTLIQSVITAINETDLDDEESVCVRPKSRMKRPQIISDSDDSDHEVIQAHSEINYTSSSAFSSQSEILNTEQQEALEKDVAKLHQQIVEYEAKLGQQSVDTRLTEAIQDGEEAENKITKESNSDSSTENPAVESSLVADEDEDSNDLFMSPLSPSPASRQSSVMTVPRRHALSTSQKHTDQYMKQFQSPGGTVRTKKSLEFTMSKALIQSENKNITLAKSLTELSSLDHNAEDCIKNVTDEQSSDKKLCHVAFKNISNRAEKLDLVIDVDSTPENNQNVPLISPVILSQKSRRIMSQSQKIDQDNSLADRHICESPKRNMSLVASGLGSDEHLMVAKLVERHGLKFSSQFSTEVTHIVMKPVSGYNRVCERTLKFFQGIAHKCWVVAFPWVMDSIQAGSLLPEEDYEIQGDTSGGESTFGPKHSRISKENLFSEFCFACVGNSTEMPKESLHDLLTACGAVTVDDPIGLFSKVAKYKFVVRCADSETAPTTAELDMFNGLYKHMMILTVMREWVLDSLGSFKLQPLLDYVLSSSDNINVPF